MPYKKIKKYRRKKIPSQLRKCGSNYNCIRRFAKSKKGQRWAGFSV